MIDDLTARGFVPSCLWRAWHTKSDCWGNVAWYASPINQITAQAGPFPDREAAEAFTHWATEHATPGLWYGPFELWERGALPVTSKWIGGLRTR